MSSTTVHEQTHGSFLDRVRAELDSGVWTVAVDDMWCTVRRSGRTPRAQGWKIHVSSTVSGAGTVLDRVCRVLVPLGVTFKFAADAGKLRMLNSREADRSSSGKFITVYPDDDAQFAELAAALDLATRGLLGPSVLSDKPVRPGSVVHYRYGGFARRAELGNDGAYRAVLAAPDGTLVEDARQAWFTPPPWAPDPLAEAPVTPSQETPKGVLVANRFAVTTAIRHSAKGGVFLGTDTRTGAEVVVKQGRAYIEVDRSGRDSRDALRHESELLTKLAHTGLTPRPVALVEQADTLFLAQERIPGGPLRGWVAQRVGEGMPDVPWEQARGTVLDLVRLLRAVHAENLVVRDLSPTNVMVSEGGALRLVDLELAAEAGARVGAAGTPGYRAPEESPTAQFAADHYSLGGLLFLLCTGSDPALPPDSPDAHRRTTVARLGGWLDLAVRHGETARILAPAVRGLLHDDPAARWDLDRLERHLDEASRAPEVLQTRERPRQHPSHDDEHGQRCRCGRRAEATEPSFRVDRLLNDGLAHLAASMTPHRADRLWPATAGSAAMDPCAVQYGAAGVLGVLARAAQTRTVAPALRSVLHEAVGDAAEWLQRRIKAEPKALPGLYFGRSGTAWALAEASRTLGDEELGTYAVDLALSVPVRWPNPDVCHGAAGAGLAQLRMWRLTGDERFRQRAVACADGLLAAGREANGLVLWPVPKDFDSKLAGAVHLGYAHGVAGVGAFLLAAGKATGRQAYLDTAVRAGQTLKRTVRRTAGAAWWAQGPTDPPQVRLPHWCSGSSGVGSFLVRLWETTGDPEVRSLAGQAAVAVEQVRWQAGTAVCHGLAGNGEFLLDLAQIFDDPAQRARAEEHARLLAARSALVDGRLVPADETAVGTSASYGTGTAGAMGFLLRLRHGGPRLWHDTENTGGSDAGGLLPEGGSE